ncbi:conserved hypothetical protein [Planktothrix sp. PCC 11201]|uniref:hypothetical protein n=1 Tax=Planktothrix sp. PCC 11201 TaxID=1729650 RepID=UPI0009100429|nr:hypothetical protein [Planktothrix sp. PCC 11201]SKB15216.1 conserved hypothetical protein [Planktothrix sp. PCC 11201]
MDSSCNFKPGQIVGLNHHNSCLYAEVIQVVEVREVCWVRPLMLIQGLSDDPEDNFSSLGFTPKTFTLSDLRQSPDLIWPTRLFKAALDTEVITFLAQLETPETNSPGVKRVNAGSAHQQLQDFIGQVWRAYTDVFESGNFKD